VREWSGYKRGEPDLFFPKPIREVWWHWPLEIVGVFLVLQIMKRVDWADPPVRAGSNLRPGRALRWTFVLAVMLIGIPLFVWAVLRWIT
jgi:hypothetical protein